MSAQATMESMPGGKVAAAPSAVLIVYAGALLQGMTLVSFPAVSAMLKQTLTLSDADYGALFLPQVAFAIVGAIAGGALARKIGLNLETAVGRCEVHSVSEISRLGCIRLGRGGAGRGGGVR